MQERSWMWLCTRDRTRVQKSENFIYIGFPDILSLKRLAPSRLERCLQQESLLLVLCTRSWIAAPQNKMRRRRPFGQNAGEFSYPRRCPAYRRDLVQWQTSQWYPTYNTRTFDFLYLDLTTEQKHTNVIFQICGNNLIRFAHQNILLELNRWYHS